MNKDLFSAQSDLYSKYRPAYPLELIEYILQFVKGRDAAWDCATGNGQAAYLLAPHFKSVFATDISEKQIANAIEDPRIHYSVSNAETSQFADHSFDLVTVAQAYHWFDFTAFKNELRRVLKVHGILAVWGYSLVLAENDRLNSIIKSFYTNVIGPYWDPERKYVDQHYETIPFPYDQIAHIELSIETHWGLEELIGYINTWSSLQHFINKNGFNPVDQLQGEIRKIWPAQESISFKFPLFIRVAKIGEA
jgi:ubiquinone/menaquinone biosynthesis C-methylase UbiE